MRVLQVSPYALERPGGVQRHILDLSRALTEAGHDVTIIAPGPRPTSGAEAVYLGRRLVWRMHGTAFELTWASTRELRALALQVEAAPFDVVHFHTPWSPLMPWQVLRRIGPRTRRRIATFHDSPPPTRSGALMRRAFRILSRRLSSRLDVMIAVSGAPESHLRPAGPCVLVRLPPCIDLRPYHALARRERPAEAPTVLFVGRLEPRKGVLLLVEALATVRAHHPRARLVVCGDGEQRQAAERLAKAMGVGEAVLFTGALDERAKRTLYADADLLCASSPYGESYGLVVAEAMAAGLPVVAAANDGYKALLGGDGAAGLVPPGSASALAERISELLRRPYLRQQLSAWGRRESSRCDVNVRLPDFLGLYGAGA